MRKALCRAASSVLLVLVASVAQPSSANAATCANASQNCTCANGFCWITNAPVMPTQNDFFRWCTQVIGTAPVESQGRVPGVPPRSLVCPCTPGAGAVMQPNLLKTPAGVFLVLTSVGASGGALLGLASEASKTDEQRTRDAAENKPSQITQGAKAGALAGAATAVVVVTVPKILRWQPAPAGAPWWRRTRVIGGPDWRGATRLGVQW